MLFLLQKIDIDPGIILFSVIFGISGLSCLIGISYYLFQKFKQNRIQRQIENDYYNL